MKKSSRVLALLALSSICFTYALAQANANLTGTPVTSPTQPPISISSPTTWPPQLLAAVFTALFTTATTFVAFLWGVWQKKKVERAESTIASTNKLLENRLVERIGYNIRSITHTVNISDLDGTLNLSFKWQDLRLIRQDAALTHIPGGMRFNPATSKFSRYPVIPRQSFVRRLELVPLEQTESSSEYQIEIAGGLNYGEKLNLECSAEVKGAFFMTREEVEQHAPRSFKKEYHSFSVVTPVERIEIDITFPEGYAVEAFPGVCIGSVLSDKYMHNEELGRIEKNQWFQKSNTSASLQIDEPIIGFSYLIYWMPPPKRLVDALRQSAV